MNTITYQPVSAATLPTVSAGQLSRPLNVVIVDDELPYPAVSGKRQRTLNLTLRLAQRHKLTFICHSSRDNAETQHARALFLEHGIRTIVVDRKLPPRSGFGLYAGLAANLLSSLPYAASSRISKGLRRAVQEHAAQHPVDLWHCEWTPCADALMAVPDGPRVVMAHHLESQLWLRQKQQEANWFKQWYMGKQLRRFLRLEYRSFARATATVTVSQDDAILARYALGAPRVEVVDNGVDVNYFRPTAAPRQPQTILFLGNLEGPANLDAVDQLLRAIWPVVRQAQPRAILQIVGPNPPAGLCRQIATVPGVELHASVPDVRPFLTTCSVLAVPQRIAGGSRIKILEALACETPVVSTQIGAEGLRLEAGEHLTVVDRMDQMAGALLDALENPEQAQSQAWRGRQMVVDNYNWDALADRLEQVWLRCVPSLQAKKAA
jgi:glycosyltransferase involved in cell wall biosynthesis